MSLKQPVIQNTRDEQGMVVVLALFILLTLTIIGLAATNTSNLETMIARTEKQKQESFYAAEAGIENMKAILLSRMTVGNQARVQAGLDPNWDFALLGPDGVTGGGDDATGMDWNTGSEWITVGFSGLSSYNYTCKLWNNLDGGGATSDKDGMIIIRSDATATRGGTTSLEIGLQAGIFSISGITGYTAQEGAGAGKNYNSNDQNAINLGTATTQLSGIN